MELIPLFPLPVVVFPGQPVVLHIFEERYKAMVADCEPPPGIDEYSPFGICLDRGNGKVEKVGCTVVVQGVTQRYPDGSFDVRGTASCRFITRESFEDEPYLTASVDYLTDDDEEVDVELANRAAESLAQLIDLASGGGKPGESSEGPEGPPLEPGAPQSSFDMASMAALDVDKQQNLLELTSENRRLQLLVDHLDELVPAQRARLEEQERAKSNGKPRKI